MTLQAFCVGAKIMEPTYEDGPRLDLTEDGFRLLISYNWPTPEEIFEIQNGKAEFCAAEVDDVLVFMAKFGRIPWSDMTFHRGLANSNEVIRPAQGDGTALHIMLVDSTTGILVAQRVIGLMNRFSHGLADMIEAQEKTVPADWDARVRQLYRKYPKPELLVQVAKLYN